MSFDQKISRSIYEATKKSWMLRHAAVFFASDLIWLVIGFVGGLVFVLTPEIFQMERFLRMGMMVVFLIGAWLVTALIARLAKRDRPYKSQGYKPIIKPFIETSSFPSAHATFSFALLGYTLVIGVPWLIWPVLVAALFVCIGRVMVGVHRLSEVVAGAFVGFAVSSIVSLTLIIFLAINA